MRKVAAKLSSFVRVVLMGWFALTIGALLILRASDIGLGQGSFAYRFSTFQVMRIQRATALIPLIGMTVAVMAMTSQKKSRKVGVAVAIMTVIGLGAATFWAPPNPMVQHSFNLRSPSQDGAFVNELDAMSSLGDYLRGFDQRIGHSPAELRGTRVISNPPGTTILFYAVAHFWPANLESPGWLERLLQRHYEVNDYALVSTMLTVQIAALLCALWSLAAIVLYRVARMFLPPTAAMMMVLIAWFNPSTAHFVPGKDPAQLLTVGWLMWSWLAAWKRDNPLLAALCGVVLAVGATIGLIHFWVMLALVCACAWDSLARHRSLIRFSVRLIAPLAAGAFAVILIVYLFTDWNLARTLFTVWRRFTQIQHELALDHTIWFFIGLPLFLLFVSPGLALFGALMIRRRRSLNFAARLALVTVAVMLLSYFIGVSYELPRLWVVFLPPLTLGLMSAVPLGRVRHEGRAARALMWVAIVQMVFTAVHWSLLDARESELRLSGPKPAFFGAPVSGKT